MACAYIAARSGTSMPRSADNMVEPIIVFGTAGGATGGGAGGDPGTGPFDEAAAELGRVLIECGAETIEPAAFRQLIRQSMTLGIDETLKRLAPA